MCLKIQAIPLSQSKGVSLGKPRFSSQKISLSKNLPAILGGEFNSGMYVPVSPIWYPN